MRADDPAAFWFDEEAADRAVAFFERVLTHTKGEWAGQPLRLAEWQAVQRRADPHGIWQSDMSRRLGLTERSPR